MFQFDLLTVNGFAIALCKETNDMNFIKNSFSALMSQTEPLVLKFFCK